MSRFNLIAVFSGGMAFSCFISSMFLYPRLSLLPIISVKKPPNETFGRTNIPSGPIDSEVDNFKSTQTSVMRVTEGLARLGTKRYDEGMDVDGRADGTSVKDGAGVG